MKKEILDHAKTVRRSNTAELNNRNNAVIKESEQKSINFFQKMFNDSQSLETLTELQINNIFGEPKNDYELDAKNQIVELSTKIGQKNFLMLIIIIKILIFRKQYYLDKLQITLHLFN